MDDIDCHGPLPPQAASLQWLHEKYARPGEFVPNETRQRVAHALALAEQPLHRRAWSERFLWAMQSGLLPGGRIMAGASSDADACLMNCFVLPVRPLHTLARRLRSTLAAGGGVGLDLSVLSAPLQPVLQGCETVAHELERHPNRARRRAALMAVLRFDHPQIDDFIQAKADPHHDPFPHFTFSVSIDDATMRRLHDPASFGDPLLIQERQRWHRLSQAVWRSGEPGLLFIDAVRRDDNLGLSESLSATNPCGEQPLPDHGACALASIDLTRVVQGPLTPSAHVAWGQLNALAQVGVRLLDNALDLSTWPLPEQARLQRAQRRMGLGLTGLADALALLGLRYGSPPALRTTANIGRFLSHAAYRASVRLARERGPAPAVAADAVLSGSHRASRLPSTLRQAIRRHGLRNAHLLAVAPTASISMAFADAVSPGVEPVTAWTACRHWRDPQGLPWGAILLDPVWRRWARMHGLRAPWPSFMAAGRQVTPEHQLATVAALAPSIDGGISKTLVLPAHTSVQEVQTQLLAAWTAGLKGISAFRLNSRPTVIGGLESNLSAPSVTSVKFCRETAENGS